MSVSTSDIELVKSASVTDTSVNGGRFSYTQVVNGAKNNIFPFVSQAERTAGVTRYRKVFLRNKKSGTPPEAMYLASAYLTCRTNAGDRKAIGLGSARDTQSGLSATPPVWVAAGKLKTSLTGGETSVVVTFESNDVEFIPGGELNLSSRFLASQTIASGVVPGDSVQLSAGTWGKIDHSTDVTYPKGWYIGNNEVYTIHASSYQERITLPTGLTEDEVIGTGDATTTPALSTLTNVTNGLMTNHAYRPVITVTVSGSTQTVTVGADGTCAGYCSAGQLNMTTGAWTTPITFTSAPDNGTDILCTYYTKFWSYSGNDCTVTLYGQVANPYLNTNSYVSGCIGAAEVIATFDNFTDTSSIYDESTYPVVVNNLGTVEDDWTITFSNGTTFSVSGLYSGSVGTGNISADFQPTNSNTGAAYFKIDRLGWMGSPANGNTITFKTHGGVLAVWMRQIVPASTAAEANNIVNVEFSWQ